MGKVLEEGGIAGLHWTREEWTGDGGKIPSFEFLKREICRSKNTKKYRKIRKGLGKKKSMCGEILLRVC